MAACFVGVTLFSPHVCSASRCSELVSLLRPCDAMFKRKNMKSILVDEDTSGGGWRRVLLDTKVCSDDLEGLPEPHRGKILAAVSSWGGSVVQDTVRVGYDALSADVVLRRLLPPTVEVPTGFEPVGHVAHFNLRDEQLPYKHLIGQVYLDKNPALRTIVNKARCYVTTAR
jgi:tRNA (guanine37-N1)-methyltransferase